MSTPLGCCEDQMLKCKKVQCELLTHAPWMHTQHQGTVVSISLLPLALYFRDIPLLTLKGLLRTWSPWPSNSSRHQTPERLISTESRALPQSSPFRAWPGGLRVTCIQVMLMPQGPHFRNHFLSKAL